jgi:small subunit ribosomal protein S1
MTNENPTQPATTTPETDAEFEASSAEFAKALQEFERRQSGAEAATHAEQQLEVGSRVSARVVSIGEETVLLDFGGRSEATAETAQFRNDDGSMGIIPGDALDLYVIENAEQVVLARTIKAPGGKADRSAALGAMREAHQAGVPVTGKVTGTNAGGLTIEVGGVRGFCPVSQIENGFCADPSVYVGQTLEFLVSSIEEGRGSVVLSRRKLLRKSEDASGRQLLAEIKPGDEREATVRRLEPFGAFVDLGGVDGLVHVSEIRHERTNHPKEALKVGEKVKVRVLKLETGKDGKPRIALSIKAASPDPWEGIEGRFTPGERVTGTVVRLTEFGAFVSLAPGIDGLVHVSEAATHRIASVKDALKKNQSVEVLVLSVDPEKRRIALSVRQALEASLPPAREPQIGEVVEGRVGNIVAFGVFVDLPEFGARASGLLPRELTGQPREAELKDHFKVGQPVKVEVIEMREGKIRLGLEGGPRPEPRAPRPERAEGGVGGGAGGGVGGSRGPGAGRGDRGGDRGGAGGGARGGERGGAHGGDRGASGGDRGASGGDRGARGGDRGARGSDRGDRGERGGDRGGRGRGEGRPMVISSSPLPEGPTMMALALRKAMEEAKRKSEAKGGK